MNDFNVVIPARYGSTRYPGKPLAKINGKSMIELVWINATKSDANEVIIATDDKRIYTTAEKFGANVLMTSESHASGTDRVCEVAVKLKWPENQVIINVQGDEPLLSHVTINECAELFDDPLVDIATLASSLQSIKDWNDPNIVKVLIDHNSFAIYFSRLPIPYSRTKISNIEDSNFILHHHGIYGYKLNALKFISKLDVAKIEELEGLEQLRILCNGLKIKVGRSAKRPGPSIDVKSDVILIEDLLN